MEGARIRRASLAVNQTCAIDAAPLVRARMLWGARGLVSSDGCANANPVMWKSRQLTAEDLDAEARRLEHQHGK